MSCRQTVILIKRTGRGPFGRKLATVILAWFTAVVDELTPPRLVRVKSRISAASWQARVEQAQRDEVRILAILRRAARGVSLNEAMARVLPASRRSWALRRIPGYRTQGMAALVDARLPREP
ncbi:MAG: hypothetical protein QME96_18390, partial [Myxococcota bacterium]|nr:hypothetical protein [Myxococcota bacterium]